MEDKDKRNSSEPSASSGDSSSQPPGSRRGSEPEMFDAHEQTLPRFTIDPGEAAPRQRTRTLLGVPSLVNESDEAPLRPPTPPAMHTAEDVADAAPTTKLSSAILGSQQVPETVREGIIDITVEVDEDLHDVHDLHDLHDLNEVTMVSDADVLALPDNTGQLQPVRLDELAAASGVAKDEPKTSAEPAYAATAPQPNSLSPREVSRSAAPQQPRDRSGRSGALLVAAVMLLATGAWFMTAGTFRRATLSTPAESTTAAATQPTTPAVEKKVEQPAEAPAPTSAETLSAAPAAPSSVAPTTTGKPEDVAAPALKQKPALTASARGERVRRTGRAGKSNATPAPMGEMPTGPTRSEVVARLESVRSSVQTCAAGRSGVADLDITIAHTGIVMHVLVGGDFAGTTEGSCIARAVRQARFPQFKQERFRLLYPYAI
jgi:cytoskeletal protein RodZ